LEFLDKQGKGPKTFYVSGVKFPKPDNLESKPDNLDSKPDNLAEEPENPMNIGDFLAQMPKKLRDTVLGIGKKAPREKIRYAIMALCQWRELGAAQLAGILRRNRTHLLGEYLKPMVDTGELQLKYPQENHPQQAYLANIRK